MRTSRVLGGVVAVIIALATVSAVVASRRDAPTVPPGGPVAAVQSYLTAVLGGRTADAARWIDPAGPCRARDLENGAVAPGYGSPGARVDLVASSESGSTATVGVEIRFADGGIDPFGGSGYVERRTFSLRTVEGAWRLTGTPWPLELCDTGG